MIIPPASLADDVLTGILEEFISREGTDYGLVELSLSQKVAALKPQVLCGDVLIVYDETLQTVNLLPKQYAAGL